jgi:hypothetical protein
MNLWHNYSGSNKVELNNPRGLLGTSGQMWGSTGQHGYRKEHGYQKGFDEVFSFTFPPASIIGHWLFKTSIMEC